MADVKTKSYKIVINGLKESISAVDSLNKQLDNLDAKIKSLSNKTVKVATETSASSKGGGNTKVLSQEDALLKQIEQTEQKIAQTRSENYQELVKQKDALKEVTEEQKKLAATERLSTGNYANTMAGMKQQLADIKTVRNYTDVASKEFDELGQKTLALTNNLKKYEEETGQFSRNVGNYASAFEKYKVEVGGVVREFDTAKQAAKVLSNELLNLPEGAKGAEELRAALQQVKSEIQDITKSSVAMDNLLDTMEGFVAVANVGQGIRGLFGVDDAEMQKSIKNLVALQNVLKGVETINKQINTREGIGRWIAPFATGIDKATAKLLVFNRALFGTGKTAKVAAGAINLFGKALKGAISLGTMLIIDQLIEGLMKLVDGFKTVDKAAEAAKETQEEVAKAYAEGSANILKYQTIVKNFNGTRKEEANLVKELNSELGSSLGTYKTLAQWMDVLTNKGAAYIKMLTLQAKAQAAFNNYVKALEAEQNIKEMSNEDFEEWWQKFMPPSWTAGVSNRARVAAVQTATAYTKSMEEELTKSQTEVDNFMESHGIGNFAPQIEKNGKKTKDATEKVEKDLANLRISNMKEGLNKTLTQLEENRRQELAKVKANGVQVEALSKEINIKYDNEIIDAKKKWSDEVLQVYSNMWDNIYSLTMQNARMTADAEITELENNIEKVQNAADKALDKKYSDYSININNISKKAQKTTGIIPNLSDKYGDTPKLKQQVHEYIGLLEEIDLAEKYYAKASFETGGEYAEQFKKIVDKNKAKLQEWLEENKLTEEELRGSFEYETLMARNYTTSLAKQYEIRMADRNLYYLKTEKAAKDNADAILKTEKGLLDKETEFEKKRAESEFLAREKEYNAKETTEINGIVSDELRKRLGIEGTYEKDKLAIQKKYKELRKKSEEEFKNQLAAIDKTHKAEAERLELNHQNEIKNIVANAHNNRIQEYRDYISRLQKIQASTPITDDAGWGVVRTSESRRQYREALEGYKKLAADIVQEKNKLQESLNKNEISFDDFQQAQRELNLLQESVSEATKEILNNLKFFLIPGVDNTFGQLMQSINTYIQAGLQAVKTVMQAINDYQDYEFDKQQEALDKENEMLQEKLDKQKEIVEEHKNNIESIEDELATSRGDRRQHLIDQLNAEMEAERRAQKEEENIQKKKDANEKKQEALEKKRREAEYKRNLLSILVSTAMATANGLATKPFVPVGIAMGALATTLGMVQYALAAKAKPYAKGGQLDGGQVVGNRHRDGGVKVLGGRAEIEGGEFITNRLTTEKNIDLLEFVNSKKKKIDVNDMLEFYSSGSVKKNIMKMSPKAKFADGGYIPPTLSNNIDLDDRLMSAFENYSNRPVYVAVTDILNKADDVRNVQVLAGLSPSSI